MAKTTTVTLDGARYEIPRITMGQTEALMELWEKNAEGLTGRALVTHTIAMSEVIFCNAQPPIGDMRQLACSMSELQAAIGHVLEFSRLVREEGPGKAMAKTSAAA
jgi:hypothetical protein